MGERSARVIVASNRAATGVYEDTSGPVITDWLTERGFDVDLPVVVPDGDPVGAALREAVAAGVRVAITTGGTGISPTDLTPEVTAQVLDYEVPGLADAIRAAGLPTVPTAVLSRGRAGVAGGTLIVNLPGSRGGVKDGLGVLDDVLEHALSQLAGGDHVREDAGAGAAGDTAAATGAGTATAAPTAAATGPESATPAVAPEPAARVVLSQVTDQTVSVDEHAAAVADRAAGAVVSFGGVVRDHDDGRDVRSLYYEGHPTASDVLDDVVAEVTARHVGIRAVAVSHRIGDLAIGDVALACAVAAAHRQEAFAACSDLVDTVKQRLPIWKHQIFADGTDEWVNSP